MLLKAHPSSCHGSYSTTSSANQFLLLIVETEQKNYSPSMALTYPLFWFIVACFELHWERWHKKWWVFCDNFVWKLAKYRELTLFFAPKYPPCLLHSVMIYHKIRIVRTTKCLKFLKPIFFQRLQQMTITFDWGNFSLCVIHQNNQTKVTFLECLICSD